MLLDRFLRAPEFREVHSVWVPASPERALEAVKAVEPRELRLTRILFAVRLLPARLLRRRSDTLARASGISFYELLLAEGFALLAEEPGRELVVGVVGRFWSLRGGSARPLRDADDFTRFDEPASARAAMNFSAEPAGDGTLLRTETRVVTTDAAGRRKFARYWRLVRPGSGLIRRDWLRAVRRRLESS